MLFTKAVISPYLSCQLNPELMAKITDIECHIEHCDSKLAEIDQQLEELKMARTQERDQDASTRDPAAVVVKDECLEREKEALKDEIERKEKELKKFHEKDSAHSQCEKKNLLELVKTKERELKETNQKLEEKEKRSKGKIQQSTEEGIREIGVNEGKIMMLEQEKARIQADLESERKKMEELRIEAAISTTPQQQVRLTCIAKKHI